MLRRLPRITPEDRYYGAMPTFRLVCLPPNQTTQLAELPPLSLFLIFVCIGLASIFKYYAEACFRHKQLSGFWAQLPKISQVQCLANLHHDLFYICYWRLFKTLNGIKWIILT